MRSWMVVMMSWKTIGNPKEKRDTLLLYEPFSFFFPFFYFLGENLALIQKR